MMSRTAASATKAVAEAGFTMQGMPARKLGANFSSIPQMGKLNALMCSARPRRGTSTWLPMKWFSAPRRIAGPSCMTLLLGRSLPPMLA
jgi:hypothetical protein